VILSPIELDTGKGEVSGTHRQNQGWPPESLKREKTKAGHLKREKKKQKQKQGRTAAGSSGAEPWRAAAKNGNPVSLPQHGGTP
jgi:hypothetical protein